VGKQDWSSSDSTVVPGKTYVCRVRTESGDGYSPLSGPVSVLVLSEANEAGTGHVGMARHAARVTSR
jgi:hypothetical protein